MQPVTATPARHPGPRFRFDAAEVLSVLGEEITGGEIARRLDELPAGAFGALHSIDSRLRPMAAAPRREPIR